MSEEATTKRTEKVYVLYASQTGNSEEAAITFAEELPKRLTPSQLQKMTGTMEEITLTTTHMQLDDFLELNKADWTRLLVIFLSSYGVGQAPLGGYRFRDLMDAWKDRKASSDLLEGVQFALCGLGDSSYTTFFQNPTVTNEVMLQVGAKRIGEVGKADAKQSGDNSQANVIARWKEALWEPLAKAVVEPALDEEVLKKMQDATIELMCEINPDFVPPGKAGSAVKSSEKSGLDPLMAVVPIIMVLIAIVAFYLKK